MNGKKKFKRILSCLFGGGQKVQLTKFAFEDFISVVGSAANSVGTMLEFAAFGRSPDAKYSRASALCFFLSTTMVFCGGLPQKTQHVHAHRHLVTGKEISSKIN